MGSERGAFQPQTLGTARKFRKLTSKELAAASGVSRQTISAMENGPEFSIPALGALSSVLRFPVEFFFQKIPVPPRDILHFRKNARVPEYAIEHARSHAALFGLTISAFRQFADFAPPKLPQARPSDQESIELAAEAFRRSVGIRADSPIRNAVHAAEAAGIGVGLFDPEDAPIHGFAHGDSALVLMLSKHSVWSRRRYSVMHETGHLVLHRGAVHAPEFEDHANRFAGAALVPRSAFWREFPRPRGGRFDWAALIAMKQRWGVSIQALVSRARDLSLIDQAQYRTAYIHISQYGWRTREPAEQEPEQPEICHEFMTELQRRDEVASLCGGLSFYLQNLEETLTMVLGTDVAEKSRIIPVIPRY